MTIRLTRYMKDTARKGNARTVQATFDSIPVVVLQPAVLADHAHKLSSLRIHRVLPAMVCLACVPADHAQVFATCHNALCKDTADRCEECGTRPARLATDNTRNQAWRRWGR